MNWIKFKIKEIINHFQNGYAFNASNYTDVGIPIISMQSISLEGKFQLNEKNNCWDEKEEKRLSNFILKKGDLIMSMTDVTPQRNLIGCSTIIDREGTFFLNQRVGKLEANENKIDVYFLDYYFKSNHWRNYCRRISSLSVQANIGTRDILNGKIKLPPKPEQTAIATLLSKVDKAIAATQNSIKAAEKLKKALMQNLLTGKLKPDGSWRSEDEFYEDEKFGKVPMGWEVKKLKEVFYVNQNSLPSQTGSNFTFRYITIEAVQTENIDFESCPEYAFKDSPGRARRIINDNDILISGVRPNLKAFAIYQKPNDENWICSTGFYILTAKDEESHKYHFYQILSEIGEKQFHSYVAGSNYPAIGDRDLKLLKLLRPPYNEQCLIEEKISSISIENSKKQNKIQTLQRLKKSLMQNLLTGKVRLPQEFIAQFEEVEETIKS